MAIALQLKLFLAAGRNPMFRKEEQLLISLQRDIENVEGIEANTVAYMASKIQEIRASLRTKNVSLESSSKKTVEKRAPSLDFKKPTGSSLADQKRKEYYF